MEPAWSGRRQVAYHRESLIGDRVGGGYRVTPKARCGRMVLLDVCALKSVSRWSLIATGLEARSKGRHLDDERRALRAARELSGSGLDCARLGCMSMVKSPNCRPG